MNKETENISTTRNRIGLGLAVWALFALAALIIVIIINGSINPFSWGGRSVFVVASVGVMSVWMILLFLEQRGKVNLEVSVNTLFDIDEYIKEPKKPLDALLTHYTNVATIGLFLALSIYALRPVIEWSTLLGSVLLALFCMAAFFIYALILLRLAKRFISLNVLAYMFIVMSVFLVDSKAVEMIIKGVPSQVQQVNPQKPNALPG